MVAGRTDQDLGGETVGQTPNDPESLTTPALQGWGEDGRDQGGSLGVSRQRLSLCIWFFFLSCGSPGLYMGESKDISGRPVSLCLQPQVIGKVWLRCLGLLRDKTDEVLAFTVPLN